MGSEIPPQQRPGPSFAQENKGPLIIGAAIILAALIVVLATRKDGSSSPDIPPEASASASAEIRDVSGTFTLVQRSGFFIYGSSASGADLCEGTGGYSDIQEGLPVDVADQDGTVLSAGALGRGVVEGEGSAQVCEFDFDLPSVQDADRYVIEVGDRGELSYSRAQLEEMNWEVSFSLGD